MKLKSVIFSIVCLISLFSCSIKRLEVKRISSFHYATDFSDSTQWLAGIEIYSYQKKPRWEDDMQFDKTLSYTRDSSLCEIKINYFHPSGEGEFFDFTLIRRHGMNEESIIFNHFTLDSTKNIGISIHYEQDGGIELPQLSHVQLDFRGDSIDYTRVLSPSKELVNHYRNFALMCADSIEFTDKISMPNINTCTNLISSHYDYTECLSKQNNYYRDTQLDSTLINGEIKVEKKISDYYYSEEENELGLTVTKYRAANNSYYKEWHTEGENFPIFRLEFGFDTISMDTIYRMEMKSSQNGKGKVFSYDIFDIRPINKSPDDLRIPITKREIEIWTNKIGQVTKFYSIGYTDKGHKLEYAHEGLLEKAKVTMDNRVIPEISDKQQYDLLLHYSLNNGWYYYNPKYKKRNKRHTLKRPSPSIPFAFQYNSKIVEKNRKENYEKWISPDSLSIYNVYYYNN